MKTLFFHGTTTDGRRFTVAANTLKDEFRLGLSLCSRDDQFCKRYGRERAYDRIKDDRGSYRLTVPYRLIEENGLIQTFLLVMKTFNQHKSGKLKKIFNLDQSKKP